MKAVQSTYKILEQRIKELEKELDEFKNNNSGPSELTLENSIDIIENSTNVFYTHTTENLILYMSPQVKNLMGYTPSEAKIKWTEFITDNPVNKKGIEYTRRAIQTGNRQPPYELELKRKDGQKIWVEVRESPVIQNGKVVSVTGTLTDITERKMAREELKRSEQTFKAIFENTGAATCIINENGIIILANQRFSELAGISLSDIENKKNWKDFVVEEDLERMVYQHNLRRKDAKKALRSYEFRFINAKGSIRHILLYIDLIPGTSNSIASLLDITQRKNLETEARDHRERYRSLFEQAADGILVGIDKGIIVEANESICKLTKYPKEELIGNSIKILFTEKELKKNPLWHDLVKKGRSVIIERNIRSKEGKIIPVEMNTKRLMDGRMQALFRDITKRKAAEQALKESEANLASVIESTEKSVWSVDQNFRILTLNKQFKDEFKKMYGILLEKGMTITDFIKYEERKKWILRYRRVLAGEKISNVESFNFPDGKKHYEIFLHPIQDNGIITGVSARSNDITERLIAEEKLKKINKELRIAKERAEESDRLKSAFLANMSHEIRTPMNGILGFTELLKDPNLSGKQQNIYIDIIQKSGTRMLNTVNDLIDISRIETGQMEISLSEVNVNEEVDNLYNFFAPEAQFKGLDMYLAKKSPDFDAIIKTDHSKLNSILTNLIKNSIKYTEKGNVEIGFGKRNDSMWFYVKDTGPGIAPERQRAIFERFIQAETDNTMAKDGSGLGLSITKAYVEMLGGEIWLESEPGKGSVFSFTIPFKT